VGGGWRNQILTPVVAALGVPVLHTWNQTVPLWQYNHHYNPNCGDRYDCGDCTHTCHPSMYEARAHARSWSAQVGARARPPLPATGRQRRRRSAAAARILRRRARPSLAVACMLPVSKGVRRGSQAGCPGFWRAPAYACAGRGSQIWLYHLYEALLDSQDALLAHWAGRPQIRPRGGADSAQMSWR